jgi:hypothetical protein
MEASAQGEYTLRDAMHRPAVKGSRAITKFLLLAEAVGTCQGPARCSGRKAAPAATCDRTRLTSALRTSHEAGALNKRNLVWLFLLFGRQSAHPGLIPGAAHAFLHRRQRHR